MTLLLFFTRGVSFEIWVKSGLIDREKLLYEEHLNQGNLEKVYWLTYGCDDCALSDKLKLEKKLHQNIIVLGMPKIFKYIPSRIGSYIYSFIVPLLYPKKFQDSDLFKTNQMDGSWSAIFAKWLYKKPLLLRTGYTISTLPFRSPREIRTKWNVLIERFAYSQNDYSVVSSYHNAEYIKEKYHLAESQFSVLYNYLDLSLFVYDNNKPRKENRILYVGRLDHQKNLFNIIKAIAQTSFVLDIYGKGKIESELRTFAEQCSANVNFYGVISNAELSSIYRQYTYYILASYQEGMPKTLLEAMASGCLCIGTDVTGIKEIIKDGVTGILSKTVEYNDIYIALDRAIQANNKEIMVRHGVDFIKENCSLTKIANEELLIFKNLVDAK